jgi:hypothetical protein
MVDNDIIPLKYSLEIGPEVQTGRLKRGIYQASEYA